MKISIACSIVLAVVAAFAMLATSSADEPARNPAAQAGDGETFAADGKFPNEPIHDLRSLGQESQPAGMICCGSDERIQISDTTQYPWRAIDFLVLYDQLDNLAGSCSGTFVGPDAILTAAHCLYEPGTGWVGDILVAPGENGLYSPYGSQFATNWWVPDGWINSGGSPLYDWGIIKMPDSGLGDTVGWVSIEAMTDQTLARGDFTPAIAGYPGDKEFGTMWFGAKDAFLSVDEFTLDFDIDVAHGQSGSAIISANVDQPFFGYIVGILTNGYPTYNSGTRIDSSLLLDILTGCSVMDCSISAFIEGGPTVTPGPAPTNSPAHTAVPTHSAPPTHIPTPTPTPTPDDVWGDLDCNHHIDIADATFGLRQLAGDRPIASTSSCHLSMDVDCSGSFSVLDVLAILRHVISLAMSFPGCPPIGQVPPSGPHQGYLEFTGPDSGFMEVHDAVALNPSGAITVEAWVYLDSYDGWGTNPDFPDCPMLVGKNWEQSYALALACGSDVMDSNINGIEYYANTPVIPLHTWTHVAMTYDGSTRRNFVNGQPAIEIDDEEGPVGDTADALHIGNDVRWDFSPDGRISDVRIWNTARTQAEIQAGMNGVEPSSPGLVADWTFDSGSLTDDASGLGGTLFGDVQVVAAP